MENRIQCLFLSALLIAAATPALADKEKAARSDQVIVPELQRRTVEKPDIDSQDVEVGLYYGVLSIEDFGSNPVWGGTLAYHITEDFFRSRLRQQRRRENQL